MSSIYTGSGGSTGSSSFASFVRQSSSSDTMADADGGVAPNQTLALNYYRNLWWKSGEFSSKAKWEQVTLPYVLVDNVSLREYELRTDKFNIHGLWEWKNNKVMIYELPSKPHETCIYAINKVISRACTAVDYTNSRILNLGATRTRADDSGKEADSCFRPMKARVPTPTGSDGESEPWPNVVVEVAYTESTDHILEKVKEFWLPDLSRVHDVIVVKIDPVPDGEVPSRMQAWHFCVSDRRTRGAPLEARIHFEFGTYDGNNPPNQLNIVRGMCLINIDLNCLYHDAYPGTPIPPALPDPIVLDFYEVLDEFLCAYRKPVNVIANANIIKTLMILKLKGRNEGDYYGDDGMYDEGCYYKDKGDGKTQQRCGSSIVFELAHGPQLGSA
ncbi:unnamed protein product [Rhizophagus irregularis]|nr:unnamed protein product [Rhizophagus irregularis]